MLYGAVCCVFRSFVSALLLFFFFNDTATTEIYTLSLHDALPIYSWFLNEVENSFAVRSSLTPSKIEVGSEAEFITEHYWGYTKANQNSSFEYEVAHPRWDCYDVLDKQINVDFELIYGDDFSELSNQEPLSVMLAEGSEISVENKRKI